MPCTNFNYKEHKRYRAYICKIRRQGEAKASMMGEPRINWRIHSKLVNSTYRRNLRGYLLARLKKEVLPQRPVFHQETSNESTIKQGMEVLLAATVGRRFVQKQYDESLVEWKKEYENWHARRSPENIERLVDEMVQRWISGVRRRNRKRSTNYSKFRMRQTKSQDLGGNFLAEIKAKTTTAMWVELGKYQVLRLLVF